MIAGLETPTTGKITIGDTVVFDSARGINIPPNKRKVGFLFQNYALWPNMTVYQNISFGLSNVKEMMDKVDEDAKEATKLIEILSNYNDVKKCLSDSMDKNGKLDNNRALLHFIDTFTISMFTAKKLLALKESDVDSFLSEQKSRLEKRKAEAEKAGLTIGPDFVLMKNGEKVQENRKLSKEEIDLSVRRVSRLVKIGPFMDRYPAELSGGQQQRVAIARTLAPEPSVLFMDEPLSNLDAKLRLEMRYELQRLHVETGSTFVYVTHDQMEAMTLATRICLIDNGRLQQYAAPLDVYNTPNNLFVADFVGNPSINFVDAKGKQTEKGIEVELFEGRKAIFHPNDDIKLDAWFQQRNEKKKALEEEILRKSQMKGYVEKSNKDERFKYNISKIDESELDDAPEPVDGDFVIGIRPECISIEDDGRIECEIYGAMPTGMESTIKVRIDDFLITGVIFGNSHFKIGTKVRINTTSDRIMLFDRVSGDIIATGTLEF